MSPGPCTIKRALASAVLAGVVLAYALPLAHAGVPAEVAPAAKPALPPAQTISAQRANEQTVLNFVSAFNEKRIDAMIALVAADVELISIQGAKLTVDAAGARRFARVFGQVLQIHSIRTIQAFMA
jgi:hypothetical protein